MESIALAQVCVDGSDCYWLESQPHQGGRIALIKHDGLGGRDLLPDSYSVKSKVHEYGGGAYTVSSGRVYFCQESDQRIYQLLEGQSKPQPITDQNKYLRYADLIIDEKRQRLICVREDINPKNIEAKADLIAIDLRPPYQVTLLHRGEDFYSNPRLSHDQSKLCWISWNHPYMPWDNTFLWQAIINDNGRLGQPQKVAGNGNESILQPRWSEDGDLFFISDRNDWWNIYRIQNGAIHPVLQANREFAQPPWVFGLSNYAFLSRDQLICCYSVDAKWKLCLVSISNGKQTDVNSPFSVISSLQSNGMVTAFIAANSVSGESIQSFNLIDGDLKTLSQEKNASIDSEIISRPEAISFTSQNQRDSHALFYRPQNRGPGKPPLLVMAHGGPTSQFDTKYDAKIQFWTSRGFPVLTVNYAGSSGYGRNYRQRLKGEWGIVDVEDCIAAANILIDAGEVDPDKIAIRGNSAGGYTVLSALTFHSFFNAGVSYYGIGDLIRLKQDTHKFESHYLEYLIGEFSQHEQRYRQRSPLFHTDLLNCPVLFFQGMLDKVVPPDQADQMFQSLQQKGIACRYTRFEDEAHGFRRAENIAVALTQELEFYQQVFE